MAVTPRSDVAALIPEDVAREIFKNAAQSSAILANPLVTTRTMSRQQQRLPVTNFLPEAYWVAEGSAKQESTKKWANQFINAEELAVIIRVHENVVNDADFNLWDEIMPSVVEAFGQKFDQAVLFGIDAPGSFEDSISERCDSVGHNIIEGAGIDFAEDINLAMGLVESDGYMVNGAVARLGVKAKLRGLRDEQGQPIYVTSLQDEGRVQSIYGEPLIFSSNGAWDADESEIFIGDWSKLLVGLRTDVTMKLSDTAVVGGESLFERDEIALRMTFRLGFTVINPPTRENPDADTRYPFAAVRPSGYTPTS
jgi:HK97 family phage major capsid protein